MASYKLSYEAEADLIGIHQFGVRQFGEHLADEYFYRLVAHFQIISDNPEHYPLEGIRLGYRRSVFGSHAIYYRQLDEHSVEVMAILGHQDRKSWL